MFMWRNSQAGVCMYVCMYVGIGAIYRFLHPEVTGLKYTVSRKAFTQNFSVSLDILNMSYFSLTLLFIANFDF